MAGEMIHKKEIASIKEN